MHAREAQRRTKLRNMKRIANGMLALATLIFAAASFFRNASPVMPYLAAFAEAAMIGAIADWFAVVALFRHPLGMRFIPHTAIVPANKARIADNLGEFVQGEFFSTERMLATLHDLHLVQRLAQWLSVRRNAEEVAALMSRALLYLVRVVSQDTIKAAIRERVVGSIRRADLASLAAMALRTLTHDNQHQAMLDHLLQEGGRLLDKPAVRERIEAMLADMLPLYFESLKVIGGKVAAERVVASVQHLITEILDDPEHELRARFTSTLHAFIDRIETDDDYRSRIDQAITRFAQSDAFGNYLDQLADACRAWLEHGLQEAGSPLGRGLIDAVLHAGTVLGREAALQDWINDRLMQAAPAAIDRVRPKISAFISHKMRDWKDEEIVDKLELHIGADLQFIRLNGTIVGGLAGLLIYTAGRWLGG